MKSRLLLIVTSIILLFCPKVDFGQAPGLGTAANFVLFSTAGAVGNTGITHLTGNVGTNTGSSTGFGNVDGQMHDNDVASAACASDLNTAYNLLNSATPGFFPASGLGNGTTLVPGVYHIGSAATLSSNLILDGQGSANAVFIFQIQGAFSTGANSKVQLINGALACNVFWKVEGLVSMAAGTTMRGNVIAHNAAISMSAGDTLEGRALSIAGAVTVSGIVGFTPIGCGSPYLTGPSAPALASTKYYGLFSSIGPVSNSGITHITGDVGTNLGLTTGFNPLFVAGIIHPIPDASTVTCAADLHNVYLYLNALPYDIELLYPAQFGNNLVLTPHTYIMNAATTFTDSLYLNAEGNANAVFIIKIYGALSTSTFANVRLINGAQTKNVYWLVNGAVLVNDNSVFNGTIVANNGAIQFNTGALLNGRALTTTGAVTVTAMTVNADTSSSVSTTASDTTVCIGSFIIITPSIAGGTWSSSNAHATVSNDTVTGLTAGIDTITYTAGTATSSNIITVKPTPTVNPVANQSVCNNSNTATVTFSGSVSGTTYAWTNNNTSIGLAGSGNGNIASFTAINSTNSPDSGIISVTPSANGCTGTPLNFNIKVNPIPAMATPSGQVVCNNTATAPVNFTSSVIGTTYTWTNNAPSIGLPATGAGNIGSFTAINASNSPVVATIIVTPSAGSCAGNTTTFTITVNPSGNVNTLSNQVVCNNTATNSVVFSGSVSGTTYTWINNTPSIGLSAGGSGNIASFTATNSSSAPVIATITVSPSANGCSGGTSSFNITVNPTPNVVDPSNQVVCNNTSTNPVVFSGSVSGTTYTWTNNNPSIGLALSGAGDIASFTATNASNSPVVATIIVAPSASGCAGNTKTFTITVNPSANVNTLSNQLVCNNTATNPVAFSGSVSGTTYTWTNSDPSIGLASSGAGDIASFTATNSGSNTVTATIIVTPSANSCNGNTSSFNITVYPTPNVVNPPDYVVCNNAAMGSVVFSGSVSGTTYTWVNSDPSIGLASNGTGNITSFLGINTAVTPVVATITVSPSANSCNGFSKQFTITVNPTPVLSSTTAPSAICNNTVFNYTPTSATDFTIFSWSRATQSGISNPASSGVDNPNEPLTNTTANPLNVVYVDTLIANGCMNTQNVIVSVNPSAKLSSQMNNAVCGKTPFIYTATSLTNNATFAWSRAAVTGITPATASGTVNVNETLLNSTSAPINVTYHFILTINGCTNVQDMILTVNPLPSVPDITTTSPSTVCSNTLYTNFGTSTAPGTNVVYSWTAVNAIVWAVGSNGQNALINFTTPGNAEVILTETINGTLCESSDTFKVAVGTDVSPMPSVFYFEYHFVCTPSNLDSYQWGYDDITTLDSTLLPGEINQDYLNVSPDFAHKYYWVNTVHSGCRQKTYYTTPLAIQNINKAGGINIYPNPAKDFINVTVNTTISGNTQIEIVNIAGQRISTVELTSDKAMIDISTLPVGFYVVRCYSAGIIIGYAKFVKN